MAISTNGTVIARLAGGLYNTVMSNATYLEVASQDPSTLANTLYARDFAKSTDLAVATTLVTNLGLSSVAGLANWVAAQLTAAGAANKGAKIVSLLNDFAGMTADTTYGAQATAFNTKVDAALAASQTTGAASGVFATAGAATAGSFELTSGYDSIVGTALGDSILADDGTWTALDSIDGGAGNDTLTIISTAAVAKPTSATVTNVESIKVVGTGTVTLSTTTGFAGLTSLDTTGRGGATVGAAATTAITVANADIATTAEAIAVTGGSSVAVSSTNNVLDTITVGSITAPAAGAVSITSSSATASASSTQGAITVTGGTSITITQSAANTAATGDATTAGAVTVNGNANTTTVTVTDTPAATGFTATSTLAGVKGRVNGAVDVVDVNSTSSTAAGVISSVTLNSFAAATVNSGALTSLTLTGKGTSASVTMGALSTPKVTTLALNVDSLTTTGAVTTPTVTTVNVTGTGTASTIASFVAAAATTVNVAGDAKVTFTDNTLAAVKAINVTNTAGGAFGTTAIGTGVTFTGGAGADSVVLSSGFTTANTMGAGNDTVTYGGAASTTVGAVGSMDAGAGTDTIIMTNAQAAAADGSAAFNTAFTNFETLRISDAFTEDALDLDGINAASKVILAAGVSGTAGINNLVSGGTVELRANGASTPDLSVTVKSALVSSSDVLNLVLNKNGVLAAGSVTAANVETINITNFDQPTAPTLGFDAAKDTLTLVATAAKTITVSGNNGLTLTNTGNTEVTSFDASGVVSNSTAATQTLPATSDTSSNLAVQFISENTTATAAVSIKGGAGADTLTGNAGVDTIVGGAGADNITGGTNADVLTGGTGADNFYFAAGDSNYNAYDVITDLGPTDNIIYGTIASPVTPTISGAVTGTASTAAISLAGVASFAGVSSVGATTLAEKVQVLDATLDVNGVSVLFDHNGTTFMYINTDTATTADLTGIVIQLTGLALPTTAITDGSATGLSGFGG